MTEGHPEPGSPAKGSAGRDGAPPGWHAMDKAAALSALQAAAEGLTGAEAAARLDRHGPNRLPEPPRPGLAARLLRQVNNLLMYVLFVAAFLAFLLGHILDGAVILAVVVVNAVIGFVQEGRAERALQAIRGMIDPEASVLRDGARATLPAEQVVPGDIVLLEAGDRVPADLRLVRARNLKIDEAVLTGESVAVDKTEAPVPAEAVLGDRACMAFSGTFVAAGQGAGLVVATGAATELGQVSGMIGRVESLKTPLVRQMDRFARTLSIAILGLAALVYLWAVFVQSFTATEGLLAVVGLAVAAIPEGLPAIMTIALAIGVQRLAGRKAIIRRLPAVETLGSVSVICSDKTGTLTRNEMMAGSVLTMEGRFQVDGTGYRPEGRILAGEQPVDLSAHPVLGETVRAGLLCNDAALRRNDNGANGNGANGETWTVDGDPMEGALVALAEKAGLAAKAVRAELPRLDEIPFDAQHRFMATLHPGDGGEAFILVKGAPERVLEMCATQRTPDGDRPLQAEHWYAGAEELAARGQRLLAFAMKPAPSGTTRLDFADVERDAVLLGFVGFIDPPREEARAAIADCRSAGIRVAMITGDHAVTAREIARQLGLAQAPRVMTGQELDRLDEAGLREAVLNTEVFARTTPEHKLRLVQALQDEGLIVAMTGDGVNDAPALKRADVGVAMGRKGTEAAKEAAEMVLADDNFATIVAAVREGRTVYDNLKKSIAFLLPINGGESLSLVAAILLGLALPIAPLQILWVNMVSSVALAAVLAFEPTEPDAMRRPPRDPGDHLLSGFVLWRVCLVSALFLVGIFGMFTHVRAMGGSVELAQTAAVNTLVVMEIFYLFSVRYLRTPSFTFRGVKGTPRVLAAIALVVVLQAAFTYAPPMQFLFRTEGVPLDLGVLIVLAGVAVLCFLEVEKWLRRRLLK